MPDRNTDRPVRSPRLEVTAVRDGLVVYQDAPESVHHLNNTAAFVFELSTGERTVEEIAEEVRIGFGLEESPVDVVENCVRQLRWQRLVL